MENFLSHLNTVNKYRIKLLSDVELEKNASIIIDVAKSNKENYTQLLESTLFGFYRGEPCEICGNKFRQMHYEKEGCCLKCRNLIRGKSGVEIAKIYYQLGRKGALYGK